MNLKNLEDLYIEQLRDLYSAENQIIEALPKMADSASNSDLQQAFRQHLEVTRKQKNRLEQIFQDIGKDPSGKHCKGMEGLIKEGEELIKKHNADPDVKDAGLITAAQRVEHYEIAGYGTVATYAQQLGHDNHASLLHQTLEEEENTDHKLTRIAESHINLEAQA